MTQYLFKLFFIVVAVVNSDDVRGQGNDEVRNLVFEGGGIRGIAYSGALIEMEKSGMLDQVERVGGTSAGAITATFLAVGFSPQEIRDITYYTDFSDFNDGHLMFVGGASRMVESYGWYLGDEFIGWLESHVARRTGNADITFGELHSEKLSSNFLDLYITGTNLTEQKPVVFSHENYPDMRIVDAVRISMSVPYWFEAVGLSPDGEILERDDWKEDTAIMIDGGLLSNFPLHVFDHPKYYSGVSLRAFEDDFKNPQTLGFRLDSQEQIDHDRNGEGLAPQDISNIQDYTVALYVMVIENLNRSELDPDDWKRTVSINTLEIGPRVKELSDEQKDALILSGRKGVSQYLSQFSSH